MSCRERKSTMRSLTEIRKNWLESNTESYAGKNKDHP